MSKRVSGFTIVELLIVIVIIAILAAITIAAFNGIQQRAKFSKLQSDLGSIRKSLQLYQADNGSYPVTGTLAAPNWRYSCSTGIASFISGVSTYVSNLQQAPCNNGGTNTNDTWLYASDGAGYKLLHIRPSDTSIAGSVPASMQDTRYSAASPTWGYWTDDWASK